MNKAMEARVDAFIWLRYVPFVMREGLARTQIKSPADADLFVEVSVAEIESFKNQLQQGALNGSR